MAHANAPAALPERDVCASDWHVINIFLGFTDSEGQFTTQREAEVNLSQFSVHYTLGGAPLSIETTPVRRKVEPTVVDPAATIGWWITAGAILAPDALSVGAHTEHVVVEHPIAENSFNLGVVTFFVDAAGTGVCSA